jgi:hypothetical protein
MSLDQFGLLRPLPRFRVFKAALIQMRGCGMRDKNQGYGRQVMIVGSLIPGFMAIPLLPAVPMHSKSILSN